MADWTRAQVEDRLESAAEVMRALPGVKPQGHFSTWPQYMHSFADKVGQEPEMRRPRPSPRAISQAEEAMLWLQWLEPELGKLLWARVSGTEWKPICWQFGISRPTAHRRFEYGLSVIVWQLNGRRVPTKRSRRYVVEGAHRATRDFSDGLPSRPTR